MEQTTGSGEPLWEPTMRDVLMARKRIAPHLQPTPLVHAESLGRRLGCDLYVKCENLNPTGAFKVRGGINLVSLESESRKLGLAGLSASSTGNHGQSIAYAARLFGLPATIFVPSDVNPLKAAAIRELGADIRLVGKDLYDSRMACETFASETGARYVHSMNEPLLIAGVATAYLEALEAVADADMLIVPIGGGSGACGASIVAHAVNPNIKVIGVQAEGAPAVHNSFRSGRLETTERITTRAEGLSTRMAYELPMTILRKHLADIVLVRDDDMEEAMRLLAEAVHVVAEEAGAAATAGAVKLGSALHGKKVIVPISGGNVPRARFAEVLQGGQPTSRQ